MMTVPSRIPTGVSPPRLIRKTFWIFLESIAALTRLKNQRYHIDKSLPRFARSTRRAATTGETPADHARLSNGTLSTPRHRRPVIIGGPAPTFRYGPDTRTRQKALSDAF